MTKVKLDLAPVGAVPARVEFFGSDGKYGYQRCEPGGLVVSFSDQRFGDIAEAIQAAYEDPENAGLHIQDPSFAHRPVAGW